MHLLLVPARPEHAALYHRWRYQPASVRHNPLMDVTVQDCRAMLAAEGHDLTCLDQYQSFRWLVQLGGELVGYVSLKGINHRMQYAEIGYGITEEHHGKGLGTAAVRLLVDTVFAQTSLRKLLAYVHSANLPSCKLLERLGFRREGLLREHFLIQGVPVDEALYAILRTEWPMELSPSSQAKHPDPPDTSPARLR